MMVSAEIDNGDVLFYRDRVSNTFGVREAFATEHPEESLAIGLMLQEPRLMPWPTLAEDVGFGLRHLSPPLGAWVRRLLQSEADVRGGRSTTGRKQNRCLQGVGGGSEAV